MSAAAPNTPQLQAAYIACREIAKREAKNFYYAFRVLPRHKSNAMCAVYAFMREAMAAWTAEWRSSRTQGSTNPVFLALNDTQRRFDISDDLLEQLVAGTTLDLQPVAEGTQTMLLHGGGQSRTVQVYETFAGLQHYCYLVASVVGLVCIKIFGYTDRAAEQLAVDTGIAFQLTNILRDVKEDADRGRIYISLDLLRDRHVDPARLVALAAGEMPTDAERELLTGLEKHAQALYRSGYALIPLLEADSRAGMRVLVRIYHRLLDRIAAEPSAVFRTRISVPTSEKLLILAGGAVGSLKARLLG